ncbi:MAG: formimidoylglutamase [Bacteroidota bacterium]|nr:formimidoylglutamase [Bacteroidota bacterium]MDP4228956.1 formimidoylglutamase [Bacteroidota bacterium]MDP4236849.1 formimidoylglutamase [Bacteroidota bacterium]
MNNSSDPRLHDLILPFSDTNLEKASVVLIGVPTDEGILRNGGRVGAAQAPDDIRRQLGKLTPFSSIGSFEKLLIADHGNLSGSSLEEIHSKAKDAISKLIASGKIVIALGGGHDVTYPLASGFHEGIGKKDFSLINIDAHLDVREKKNGLHHSGSSFRLLIEESILKGKNFTEFGIQQFAYSDNHLQWALGQGAKVVFHDDLYEKHVSREFASYLSKEKPNYVSFDIDSVRSSDVPGSSAPSPTGLHAEDAVHICYEAGLNPLTQMLDIVEVNPLFDYDHRTTKLAARMIAMFLLGVAKR